MNSLFPLLGEQLRRVRKARGFSQPDLAKRVGRDRARISELERDLIGGRLGRDRLTLLAEICDALGVVPVLVPRAQQDEILRRIGAGSTPATSGVQRSAFDDVFVDLDSDDDD